MYDKSREHIETNTFNTFKIILKPTLEQKNILKLWLDDCIDVYNMTNQYLHFWRFKMPIFLKKLDK